MKKQKAAFFFFFILSVIPFVLAVDPCKNGIKDGKEQGVDCGFFVCGRPCVVTEGTDLLLPGEAPKISPSSVQKSAQPPVQSPIQSSPKAQPSQQTKKVLQPREELPPLLPEISKIPEQLLRAEEGKPALQEIPAPTQIDWRKITRGIMNYFAAVFRYILYLSLLFVIFWGGHRSYKAAQPHTDPEVIKYIKSCLEKNIPKEKIHAKLKEAGHTQKTIEHHFRQLPK